MTPERFFSGYTWEEYLDRIQSNRDQFERYYEALELTGAEIEWLRGLPGPIHVMAIGESWCPDVFTNLPVVPKIASYSTG